MLRWSLIQRGLWVNGVDSIYDYVVDMFRYELSPVAKNIACPTFLSQAMDDPVADYAPDLYAAITAPEGPRPVHDGGRRRHAHRGPGPHPVSPADVRLAGRDAGCQRLTLKEVTVSVQRTNRCLATPLTRRAAVAMGLTLAGGALTAASARPAFAAPLRQATPVAGHTG